MSDHSKAPKRFTDLVGKKVVYRLEATGQEVKGVVQHHPYPGGGKSGGSKNRKRFKRINITWYVLVTDDHGATHPVPASWVRVRRHRRKVRV